MGLKITTDLDTLINESNDYAVVQELLQDSYLVNGRKINLRVYVVVACNNGIISVYMYNNGFMYYTKKLFVKNDISIDNNITTGYVERDVYTKNPLTHDDFKKYLDLNNNEKYHSSNNEKILSELELSIKQQGISISQLVFSRIEQLLRDVFISFKGHICNSTKISNDYSIQIFGADVAINEQLQPQIIEINKGPDLSPKDERDGIVKQKLVSNVFEIINLIPMTQDNGLNKILTF